MRLTLKGGRWGMQSNSTSVKWRQWLYFLHGIFVRMKWSSQPWLVWFSGLSAGLRSKGSSVRFPVRAHAWVSGQVPSWGHERGNHTLMFLSLSPFLPLCLKINNIFKKKHEKKRNEVSEVKCLEQGLGTWALNYYYY